MNYLSSCFTGSTSATEISKDDIGVGAVEFEAVSTSISNIPLKRKYITFTREKILNIGKYASIHGNSRAARKYSVGESTVRLHWKKYEQDITSSTKVKRGRPLLLQSEIDEKVMKYLHAIRKKGDVVNTVVATLLHKL